MRTNCNGISSNGVCELGKRNKPHSQDVGADDELEWIRMHSPRTVAGTNKLPNLKGCRIACSIHLDMKLVGFVKALLERGAAVFLIPCNRKTTQDECVKALKDAGAEAYAWRDMPEEEYQTAIEKAISWNPTHLCEMGADITNAIHTSPADSISGLNIVAALEATGSGIAKLERLQLKYPVFNWDDVVVKECLHNRYMVGLSTWVTFMNRTKLSLHEKTVLVVGFGLVGQGVAESARAFGAAVVVVERDPGRIIPARFAGWRTSPSLTDSLLADADVVVTATGARDVVTTAHCRKLRDKAFLLNVGHHDYEIDVRSLYATFPHREIRPHVTQVDIEPDRRVFVIADGSMANLSAGFGDSINAFDTVVAVMLGGINHVTVGPGAKASPGTHLLPQEAWQGFM